MTESKEQPQNIGKINIQKENILNDYFWKSLIERIKKFTYLLFVVLN